LTLKKIRMGERRTLDPQTARAVRFENLPLISVISVTTKPPAVAYIFHNCKRRTIGLRKIRGRE
jgi:hypothetical protein